MHFDSQRLPITCPKCGHKFTKTVGGVKRKPQFACPGCGHNFDAKQMLAGFKKAEEAIDDFRRKIREIGRRP
jgi:transposase-like protein